MPRLKLSEFWAVYHVWRSEVYFITMEKTRTEAINVFMKFGISGKRTWKEAREHGYKASVFSVSLRDRP